MTTIQFRRGTAAEWTTLNPILAEGELGYELDTTRFKIGDGVTAWNSLSMGSLMELVASATAASETVIRQNIAITPYGDTGWHTSSGYGSTFDPNQVAPNGNLGARKYTKSATDTGRYFPYGRNAGSATLATVSPGVTDGLIEVVPGTSYGVGMYGMSTLAVTGSPMSLRFTMRWIDANGNSLTTSNGSPNQNNIPANTWRWVSHVATAPAGAKYLSIENIFDFGVDGSSSTPNQTSWFTQVLVEPGRLVAPTAADYFDGFSSTSGTAVPSWTGRPRASTSKMAVSSYIAKRDSLGNLKVNTPVSPWDATPKSYVDAMTRSGGGFINVKSKDYAAKGDGVTLDQAAIQNALNDCELRGGGIVYIPAGTYIITGLYIPSKVHLWGAGIGITTLLMKSGLPWDNRAITNSNNVGGNTNWGVYEMTVDGNQPNRIQTGGQGGIFGTNISVVNSSYVWLTKVESIRAMQHNFDITANGYLYNGDAVFNPSDPSGSGNWSTTPSRYVWVSHCRAEFHGDDAFTTHGSEFIWFDHCWAGTTWKAATSSYENTNGFEIDDGSRHVWLSHCYSQGNAHGFEVKAHGNVVAAFDVHLDHCVSYNDEISFSLRHIGHHVLGDPISKSAKHVTLTSCTSLYPRRVFTGTNTTDPDATNEGNNLRSLSIGAYRGVEIIGFTAIGDPGYDYKDGSTIVFEFYCEDIIFSNFHIEGFVQGTGMDIYAKGGSQPMSHLTLTNGTIRDSHAQGMSIGSNANVFMNNVKLSRDTTLVPASTTGGFFYGNHRINGNRFTGFKPNYNVSSALFDVFEDPIPANVAYVPA